MSQQSLGGRLLAELDRSESLHARVVEDAEFADRRRLLREWQRGRLGRSHHDLLASPRFHRAAEFFLVDLYGPLDLSRHLEEVRRIMPILTSVLPEPGLATVARAIELNALSESLDGDMVEALGERANAIDERAYCGAYRRTGRRQDRQRQIDLIALLGQALDALSRQRFIGMSLRTMRRPAQLAGLGELQSFLERGYGAFGAMRGGAAVFVSTIVTRERAISAALFAGDDSALRVPPD
jgi:hypothetical protein